MPPAGTDASYSEDHSYPLGRGRGREREGHSEGEGEIERCNTMFVSSRVYTTMTLHLPTSMLESLKGCN